jgi:uncharacterized membrane protein YphA (DoxX/SURF4 family)
MNALTRTFLVLLRLAIGWHFLFEGIEKIQSVYEGPTETNRPWTSEGYLREASGPFRDFFRKQAGDVDEAALERLTPLPANPDIDPGNARPYDRFPPALAKDWDDYYERFTRHYTTTEPLKLNDLSSAERALADVQQRLEKINKIREESKETISQEAAELKKRGEAALKQSKGHTVIWLLQGKKKIKKTFPSGAVEVEETTPRRVEEYRQQVKTVRDLEGQELRAFERDVLKDKLRAAKASANRMRAELLRDLGEQSEAMAGNLDNLLTDTQKKLRWRDPAAWGSDSQYGWLFGSRTSAWLRGKEPVLGSVPEADVTRPVDWIDRVTMYGLTAVGVGLILGLFTRLSCIAGAAFLLLFYLAMPPFPGVPENLRAEGHYWFVNKNLIEMIALLALATTPSGRWVGVDGLLRFLNPRNWKTKVAERGSHSPAAY